MDQVWDVVRTATAWLDDANGRDERELSLRMLKVTEEAGEVASAWIGAMGQNPRKGVTHTRTDVAAELADVVITALVAIESLGLDSRDVLAACAAKVASRLPATAAAAAAAAAAVVSPSPSPSPDTALTSHP
jgi:NTP pyrophosphatase (non-canonical NTP hydrolase)